MRDGARGGMTDRSGRSAREAAVSLPVRHAASASSTSATVRTASSAREFSRATAFASSACHHR